MEMNAFDITSPLKLKGGAALLRRAPAGSPAQEVQPDGNSLFAGLLEQKISEGALSGPSGSASGTPTAAQGKKRPLPVTSKGTNIAHKGEPAADGKAKPKAAHLPGSPICGEPIGAAAAGVAPLAGPAETMPSPLTGKVEPAATAKITLHIVKESPPADRKVAPATGMPAAAEADSPAGPAPAESDACPIVQPHATDTALCGQPCLPRETEPLEKGAAMPPTGELLKGESPALISTEPPPAFGHDADRHTPLKGNEHAVEPSLMREAVETVRPEIGEAADAAPDPDLPGQESEIGTGTGIERRRAAAVVRNDGKPSGEPKEGASVAAAPEKPSTAVPGVEPGSERTAPAGSANRSLPAGNSATEGMAAVRDHQQIQGTAAQHPAKHAERDPIPFHVELTNTTSLQQDAGTATPAGPSGADMQGVIDQILAARQNVSSDSGRIRILLNPPNLGAVDLEIVVRGERVEVVMTAENATVQQALQSRGDDIRISLQRQDLKIEGFQVLLQDNGAGQQQARGDAMYGEGGERRERFDGEDRAPELPAFSSPIMGRTSVEGRVSIFA